MATEPNAAPVVARSCDSMQSRWAPRLFILALIEPNCSDLEPVKSYRIIVQQLTLLISRTAGEDFFEGTDPVAQRCAIETNGPVAAEDDARRAERVEAVVD